MLAVVLAGCVAVGVVARFLAPPELWLDEAQSVAIARLPLPELFAALEQDGSPPLYYLLLHGWTAVFGTSATAVRALSAGIGVLTLPLAWHVARRLAGRRVAVALVVLLATSPFLIRYSSETRMYALLVLLIKEDDKDTACAFLNTLLQKNPKYEKRAEIESLLKKL